MKKIENLGLKFLTNLFKTRIYFEIIKYFDKKAYKSRFYQTGGITRWCACICVFVYTYIKICKVYYIDFFQYKCRTEFSFCNVTLSMQDTHVMRKHEKSGKQRKMATCNDGIHKKELKPACISHWLQDSYFQCRHPLR